MSKILRRYPVTLLFVAAIFTACLIPIPETPLSDVQFIDKWTHTVMYLALGIVFWTEYYRCRSTMRGMRLFIVAVVNGRTYRNNASHPYRLPQRRMARLCRRRRRRVVRRSRGTVHNGTPVQPRKEQTLTPRPKNSPAVPRRNPHVRQTNTDTKSAGKRVRKKPFSVPKNGI
jgi:hypothetical protein